MIKSADKDKGFHRNETACPLNYEILKDFSRENRSNMTEAEKKLWYFIKDRSKGLSFRRQHIIGDYIVDFVCLKRKLVIEVDGGYHFTPEQMQEDAQRSNALQRAGYSVLRFTNDDIFYRIEEVLERIYSPTASPKGEELQGR